MSKHATSKIHEITPIKDGMSKTQAEVEIKSFVSNLLSTNLIKQENIHSIEHKVCGVRPYTLISLKDGSSWVQGDKGLERVIGSSYLGKQVKDLGEKWEAVETKCFLANEANPNIKIKIKGAEKKPLENLLTIGSNDVISCSKYVGDKKPEDNLDFMIERTNIGNSTGFHDFMFNANLREQENGKIVIIDTEYGSFSTGNLVPISLQTASELGGLEFSFPLVEILGQEADNNI